MARMVYCLCPLEHEFEAMCDPDAEVLCPEHLIPCQQLWWQPSRRRAATVWDKSEWAYVDRKADGSYSFPMRPDLKPPPEGYERITVKSDQEMARVEREAKVRSERRWYDKGSGQGFDDHTPSHLPARVR